MALFALSYGLLAGPNGHWTEPLVMTAFIASPLLLAAFVLVERRVRNPLVPGDEDESGIPVAVIRLVIHNKTDRPLRGAVCGTIPNFIGADGSNLARDWKGDPIVVGPKKNRNEFRKGGAVDGIFMASEGVDPKAEQWGTMALSVSRSRTTTLP